MESRGVETELGAVSREEVVPVKGSTVKCIVGGDKWGGGLCELFPFTNRDDEGL